MLWELKLGKPMYKPVMYCNITGIKVRGFSKQNFVWLPTHRIPFLMRNTTPSETGVITQFIAIVGAQLEGI